MANTPRMRPNAPPASPPHTSPRYRLLLELATIAAVNAPMSNWPSIAMLMMPERSQRMPAMAPRTSGIDRSTELWRRPTRLSVLPAPAQHRNESTKRKSTATITARLAPLRRWVRSHSTPREIETVPAAIAVGAAGTWIGDRWTDEPGSETPKIASPG